MIPYILAGIGGFLIGNATSKQNFKNGGVMNKNEKMIEDFDISQLDAFESMQYKDLTSKGISKADALKILINNVEGDYSQLSESLAELAELLII